MDLESLRQRIWIDPKRCSGKPCNRSTRLWVSLILGQVATGTPASDILQDYPGTTSDDIVACIAYGSEMARVRFVDFPLETSAA
jgi:uncharacterized protein (DUF433 family)